MRTKQYNALFRRLAETHVDLLHSEKNVRFLRMTLSSDPVERVVDLNEFNASIKYKIKQDGYFLLLQSYEAGYSDNKGDRTTKYLIGAIIVMRSASKDKPEEQEEVYDRSEQIGEEIMAAAMRELNNLGGIPGVRMIADDITSSRVAQVAGQYYGTRFDFSFEVAANKELKFNPSKFQSNG